MQMAPAFLSSCTSFVAEEQFVVAPSDDAGAAWKGRAVDGLPTRLARMRRWLPWRSVRHGLAAGAADVGGVVLRPCVLYVQSTELGHNQVGPTPGLLGMPRLPPVRVARQLL